MKTAMKVALGLVLGVVLLIAGCTALVGAGASSVSNEIDKQEAQSKQHARDLRASIKQVHQGMTRAEVIGVMGKPEDSYRSQDSTLGTTEMLSWDALLAGHVVTVTLSDGKVISIDRSEMGS